MKRLFHILMMTMVLLFSGAPTAFAEWIKKPSTGFVPDTTANRYLDEKVIVGKDTVNLIIREKNYGRYDRGLFNYLFMPKGQWTFNLTASYGELNTEDIQILSLLNDIDVAGKIYSINPAVSYTIRNNQSLGLRFNYTRGQLDLGSLGVDIDADMNFLLKDVSYYSQSYGVEFFYRNYIGLSNMKRFGIFNEVGLDFASGSSRFSRLYAGEPKDTKTQSTQVSLNFSPGVTVFVMDYVSFSISFGIFGVNLKHEKQWTNGVEDGTRTTSGANFRFNLFNINFGLGVHI